MLNLALVFDNQAVRRPPYRFLLREYWSLVTYRPVMPSPTTLPCGDGRAVLLVPGFLTTDWFRSELRTFLNRCGYQSFGWGLGLNWGPTPRLLAGLEHRLRTLHAAHGKVALVGISLGGLLARNLAYDHPDLVSHVVTIASPIALPTASTLELAVRLCARRYSEALQPQRLRTPLPVPSTMIFTRDDGFVAPETCSFSEPGGAVYELAGPHVTLASTPEAAEIVVRRLAATQRT